MPQNTAIKIQVCEDSSAAADVVAQEFIDLLSANPSCVLGLATGGTPVQTYKRLVQRFDAGECHFQKATSFNLDEYLGLGADHPQSFRYFMDTELFNHIDLPKESSFVPDGLTSDSTAECARYEAMIARHGGIDLQLLGLGHNGHIAFNEPGSPRDSRTRQVDLTGETIEKNARFFDSIDDVPRHALTMGIGTILEAKRIVLLATGEGKRDAVDRMLHGPVTSDHPASYLQTHSNVLVVVDQAAAGNNEL